PRSGLEEVVGFFVVEEEGYLGAEGGVALEVGVGVDEVEGQLAGALDPDPMAAERGQLEVVAALLARSHEGALAPQVEVYLGQLEAVGALDHGIEPGLAVGGGARPHQPAGGGPAASTDAAAQLVQLGDAEAVRIQDHHDG